MDWSNLKTTEVGSPKGAFVLISKEGTRYRKSVADGTVTGQLLQSPNLVGDGSSKGGLEVTSKDVLTEMNLTINQQSSAWVVGMTAAIIACLSTMLLSACNCPGAISLVLSIILFLWPGFLWAQKVAARDKARRAYFLNYSISDGADSKFQKINAACLQLNSAMRLMAGASKSSCRLKSVNKMPHIDVNISVCCINFGFSGLFFFPDQILIRTSGTYAGIPYESLKINYDTEAIQGEAPSDAPPAKLYWIHANKDGGRDRRFKENYQYPVTEYARLTFTTPAGPFFHLLASNHSIAKQFRLSMNNLMKETISEKQPDGRLNEPIPSSEPRTIPKVKTKPRGKAEQTKQRDSAISVSGSKSLPDDLIDSASKVAIKLGLSDKSSGLNSLETATRAKLYMLDFAIKFMLLDELEKEEVDIFVNLLSSTLGIELSSTEAEDELYKRANEIEMGPTENLEALLDLCRKYDQENEDNYAERTFENLRKAVYVILTACSGDTRRKLRWLVIGAIKSRKYGDVFQRRAWVTGKKWHETGTGKLGKKQIVCKMVEVQGCSLNLRAYAIEARK